MSGQASMAHPVPVATPAPVAVVGVGVSAESFRSFETLFALLPHEGELAYVVVSQSEDGVDPATLVETINRHGGPPARLVADGDRIEPGRCYVAPADAMVTLEDGHVRLRAPEQQAGDPVTMERGTIDGFLISLAEEQGQAAVGVLLAELRGTGSIGFARLKEWGGLTLAEARPGEEAPRPDQVDGAKGLADVFAPLSDIPARLLAHANHLRAIGPAEAGPLLGEQVRRRLPAVAAILRERTGYDFHGYREADFLLRIRRRMHVARIRDPDAYAERLRGDRDEVQQLFQDLLIGATRFFREPAGFAVVQQTVIPALLAGRAPADTLRVWVLGCATGEEAYSLAMLIGEALAAVPQPPRVQIFATDSDARALAVARAGRYARAIEEDIGPERLARWFVREGDTYCVHRELREMCVFASHSMLADAPFSRIDLISCRNLLVYLDGEMQDRLIQLFHFSLRADGYLCLGPAENVTRHPALFAPVDRECRVFQRVETGARVVPVLPLARRAAPQRRPGGAADPRLPDPVAHAAERLMERHAPPYLIADSRHEVLHFSGHTGPFLDPASGAATLNLINLVHPDLRIDLLAALGDAASERRPVRIPELVINRGSEARRVGLTVEPLVERGTDGLDFVVVFHDHGLVRDGDPAAGAAPGIKPDEHVRRLEAELRAVKDRLLATLDALESATGELHFANQESHAVNEKLQTANEELENSKEELESLNEELQTVNTELAHRVSELARANSDLKNLLESTQIATLFLDNELRVKSFTPTLAEILRLIPADQGRPISDIAPRVPYPELAEDVRRVLRTLTTIERQIGPPEGPRYLVRVLPYRSLDNFIAGAVLTFLDITDTTHAQAALRGAQERARLANSAGSIVTWELDSRAGHFRHAEEFEATLGFPPPATLRAMLAMLHPDDRERVSLAFDQAFAGSEPLDAEGRVVAQGEEIWIRFNGARSGEQLLGVFQNVNDRRRAEAQRSLLLAELQHRVKNILAVVRSVAQRTLANSPTLEEFSRHFSGRIDALARTQRLLASRSEHGIALDELVSDELAASLGREGEQVTIEGPTILLKEKAAETLALAVHELTTNAVKYGALASRDGRLAVCWRIMNTRGGGRLSLEWRESGVPLLDTRPRRTGFGRTLIERGLPYDLGAMTTLEFAPGGVRCTVELALGPEVILGEAPETEEEE